MSRPAPLLQSGTQTSWVSHGREVKEESGGKRRRGQGEGARGLPALDRAMCGRAVGAPQLS